ncbi:putative sulfurylase large subunit (molybdopterin cytosine dinucleotide biosynthesis) [Hoeflea marina]|uniref:Putative sulfurylase large subunit (Molybdopterin cytosine dinucleotide biosynthesis) n=1 Tax=Hoeflea marina TaxID=274592 RepID=A0A317PSC6_9HYPH|nr:XdhC family protein [Hoeflea marina]PWW04363.1 putative sulfurylase large subunit (molybdopterin cytosine dinucleotide biosynthesis) [Hoeflea marina]
MDPNLLKKLNAARRERKAVIAVTDLGDGRDRLVHKGDAVAGDLGAALEAAFRTGKSGLASVEGREFFLNVHVPPARLVIIGAVHISQVLAPMARMAGFDVLVIDPRTAFATPERFEGTDLADDWPEDALKERPLDAFTALVAVTHDPKIDDFPLIEALRAGCFYIGALGSKKTHARRVDRLGEAGLAASLIGRIAAPIGLDIGAANPPEIAVAILAQVVAALRQRTPAAVPARDEA